MPPRRKKKDHNESQNRAVYNYLANLELTKFCPKKFFDIILIADADESTNGIIEKIISTSKEYEEISRVSFITYDEVLDIMRNFNESDLPPNLIAYFSELVEKIKGKFTEIRRLSSFELSQLMKLKLIEVMYQHYLEELSKMEKRKTLEEELNKLSTDSKKKGHKKSDLSKDANKTTSSITNEERRRSKQKPELIFEPDLTEYIDLKSLETENSIVFDEDISNQVFFYILHGFYDTNFLKELISVQKIPIRAIVQIQSSAPLKKSKSGDFLETPEIKRDSENPYSSFWNSISDNFDGPYRCEMFEDTILMKYQASGNEFKKLFEELLFVIESISDIKLKHLNYIRHIKLQHFPNVGEKVSLDHLRVYNNLLKHLPIELVDEHIVLSGLLEEIDYKIDNVNVLKEYDICQEPSKVSIAFSDYCKSPCDIQGILKAKRENVHEYISPNLPSDFLIHESNILHILLKIFKDIGFQFEKLWINIKKKALPFTLLEKIEQDFTDVSHKHDIDPSTKTKRKDENLTSHLLYLFLFVRFEYADDKEEPGVAESSKNLQIHDSKKFWMSSRPVVINDSSYEEHVTNLYDTFPMEYIWKEKLAQEVLIQEFSKAQQEFLYMDMYFSPETDNLLVQLSDHPDDFGVNTKIHEETLVTPVCLRDFCKYVSIEEDKWTSEENKPSIYTKKEENKEQCEGAKKIRNLDLYKNYRHLLKSKMVSDENIGSISTVEDDDAKSFENILDRLKNYPNSEKLMNECGGEGDSEHLLGYDLGTKYFSVRGARTIFLSHDDVKLIVDNTRLIDENARCSVNLSCLGNVLSFNAKRLDDYNFHYTLKDKTIITFTLQDPDKTCKPIHVKNDSENVGAVGESVVVKNQTDTETMDENSSQRELQNIDDTDMKVITVDAADFEAKLLEEENPELTEIYDTDIYSNLRQAIAEGCALYKVDKLNYVRKINNKTEIPLTSVLRRVLREDQSQSHPKLFNKRYMPSSEGHCPTIVNKSVDFRICLPNGLYISCYTCQNKENLVEVKQENLNEASTENEEFRLFTREGSVLIKKTDGTIALMKSCGEIITFEKPDSDNEYIKRSNLKKCHCRDINDYRKRVNRIMKKRAMENAEENKRYVSRRAFYRTKKGYIINNDLADILKSSKVPYLKTVLLRFDGNKTTLEKNRITQKKMFHTVCEQDFFTEEIYHEREDGMQSILNKHGCQVVKYADGTKISSKMHESKQLVDGYVYVSLTFLFEHPYYATVSYSTDDNLKIFLNNDVSLERQVNDILTLRIGPDIMTTVNENSVAFEKQCNACKSKYMCSLNTGLLLGTQVNPTSQFLHAQDSYNKHFYTDFQGNCKRNKDYWYGPINVVGCNHHEKNIYKKLFIINRTSGEQFWSNNMIESKKRNFDNDDHCEIEEEEDGNNEYISVMKFKKHIFDSLETKFLNNGVMKEDLCLSKYRKKAEKASLYTTIRILKKLLDYEESNGFLSSITFHLKHNTVPEHTAGILKGVLKVANEHFAKNCMRKVVIDEEQEKKCDCQQIKKTFADKISRWREECDRFRKMIRDPKIPRYFESQFCRIEEHK
ncbi:hypothetical protein JTB14_003477 [Gonioctena quinquepunctata]|nr:hypothetical protein JTB14_003477 [Gonioctena quinquepunctata]